MNKTIILIILIITGLKSYSCDCLNSPTKKSIDTYNYIFVAEVKSGIATVIKNWTGDFEIDQTFEYNPFEYNCSSYSDLDNATLVFFISSKNNQFCSTTIEYHYFNDIEYLDQKYKGSISISPNSIKKLDSLEYERKHVIHSYGKNDIKDKNVVFIEKLRNPIFNTYRIIKKSDIIRQVGFYSTFIIRIEKDYRIENCYYDYVFLVSTSHNPPIITDRLRKIIERKIKKACT